MTRSIVLLGGPDSGKTNYIGTLWQALDTANGALRAADQPDDISFVLEVSDHLFAGDFAPRTEHSDVRRDFEVTVAAVKDGPQARIVVPDMSGELWRSAVVNGEIAADWMDELESASGALLFIRVDSDQDARPLDWVTSRTLLERIGDDEGPGMPTQVMLCELIRFLQVTLANREDGSLPRLSVVVTAWDRVDAGTFRAGPLKYLEREYPLVAGKLAYVESLDVKVYGLSSVGGDLKNDPVYRTAFLEAGARDQGWISIMEGERWVKNSDITLPIAWAVGL